MTHKIPWDFVIQTDLLIPKRRPDLVLINKKEKISIDFVVPMKPRVKIFKKSKNINLY